MRYRAYLACALIGAAVGSAVIWLKTADTEVPLPPALPAAPTQEQIRRIPELIRRLTVQDDPRESDQHGPCHRIKASVERELWSTVSTLPVAPGNDELLADAVDEVYTKYHKNYYVGYIFHYPYLNSVKAIELCDKLIREYPASERIPPALWLKAFALRVKPPPPGGEVAESFEPQFRWKPRPDEARRVYQQIIENWAGHPYADRAKKILTREPFLIDLPISFDDDPRSE